MLKPKKKLNYKFFKQKKIIKSKKLKLKRLKKILKHKPHLISLKFKQFILLKRHKINCLILTIKVTSNNVFCNLKNPQNNKTLLLTSAGKNQLQVSKKSLKFNHKIIIQNFLEKMNTLIQNNNIIINFIGPKKIKKKITQQLLYFLVGQKLIIRSVAKKCFNGCRPSKKRRKKRKGLRLFKKTH